ncbi:MAG: aminomethyltransferase family protein [Alphaproteobacteria bacterium]|nr:aminomethyltransferase family protein [Alphaproteobacteria bacterium]
MSISMTRAKSGMRPTAFYPRLKELSQTGEWVHWAGYKSPMTLESVELEYFAIRSNATVFDISPMCKYRITGPDAAEYMNRLVTRDVRKIKNNRVAYTVWCNDEGFILDDGTIFRFGENDFRLCCQERQFDWLSSAAIGFDVKIVDETDNVSAIQFQGPTTCWFLKRIGLKGIENLKPFDLAHFEWEDTQIMVSRTGFTGDLGYEVWVDPEYALRLWDQLFGLSKERNIRAIGSAALDLARIEAGFLLPNVDFISADYALRSTRGRSPFEMGLDWLVDFNKGHFNGRRALLARTQNGGDVYNFVGFEIDGNKPAHNALIYSKKRKEVGYFTSAMWSPTLKSNIGMALINRKALEKGGDGLWAEIYLQKELKWDRSWAKLKLVDRPFFKNKRRGLTPPADT